MIKRRKIKCSCGHFDEVIINAENKRSLIEKEAWMRENHRLCKKCYMELVKDELQYRQYMITQELRKFMAVPKMKGTEAQADWAETIRIQLLAEVIEMEAPGKEKNAIYDLILKKDDARWFIDNRYMAGCLFSNCEGERDQDPLSEEHKKMILSIKDPIVPDVDPEPEVKGGVINDLEDIPF